MKYLSKTISAFFIIIVMTSMNLLTPKNVIFFGDSITYYGNEPGGYINILKNRLKTDAKTNDYNLIGAGVSSNKVYDLFFRFQKDVLDRNPDVVMFFVGINDVWHKSTHGTGTDEDRYIKFYSSMIETLKDKGVKVVLCTPSLIGEKKNFINQQDGDLNKYAQIVRDLALKYDCKLIDLRKELTNYEQINNKDDVYNGLLTKDGVHMKQEGNQMLADLMYPTLFQ